MRIPRLSIIAVALAIGTPAWAGNWEDCLQTDDPDLSITGCTAVITAGADEVTIAAAYYNRGTTYDEKGQPDRAIQDYDRAIALNPNFVEAYINRGKAYDEKGQHDRAIEDYDRAIALKPNYFEAYINRGLAYAYKGQRDRAIEDYDRAIALNPNFGLTYYNRGVAYEKLGKLDLAEADYRKAQALNTADPTMPAAAAAKLEEALKRIAAAKAKKAMRIDMIPA